MPSLLLPSTPKACYPTSYAFCGKFTNVFDRLYEARDESIYSLTNPMQKTPVRALYEMPDKEGN